MRSKPREPQAWPLSANERLVTTKTGHITLKILFTLIEVSQTMRLLWIVFIRIILTNILFIILLTISFQIIQQFLVTAMAVWEWVLTSFKCLTLSLLLLFHGFNGPAFALNCHFEQFIGRALCGGWESLSFPESASSSPSSYPLSSYTLPVSKTTCLLQTQHQEQIFPCPIKLLFFSYSTRLTRMSKLSSPRAESARAFTGRRCPHSGKGEAFLTSQSDLFTETAVTPEQKVEKSFPRSEINRHGDG